jgi:hypothetical protein
VADIPSPATAAKLDGILASYRPFADGDYISAQFQQCYKRRLIKLSDAIPVAADIVDALDRADPYIADRVLGDTAIRAVIQQLRRLVVTGRESTYYGVPTDLCRELLEVTGHFLLDPRGPGPLSLSLEHRLGSERHHPWIWTDARSADDIFARTFRLLVRRHYDGELYTPNADEVEMLRQGASLLAELLPLSSRSILRHTHIVVTTPLTGPWKRMRSSSQYLLGGTIFLSSKLLDNPWAVAEHLYHESIHQRLYDLRHCHTVLAQDSSLDPDLNPPVSFDVQSLWNYPDNIWDTHRVLAAFHVYVHLALLCIVAEERAAELEDAYGTKDDSMTPSRAAVERAHYLGEKLRSSCWQELGRAGQLLVQWLTSILDTLDSSPPPEGSYVHLLLNRYLREAERVRKSKGGPEVSHQARLLADDEATITIKLLDEMNEKRAAERLRTELEAFARQEPNVRFAEVRHVIASTLRGCCPDGYSLRRSDSIEFDPNKIVTSMVERSSRLLVAAQQIDELDGLRVQDALN